MATKDPIDWMLSDAIGTLARAERLHQQFLKLRPMVGTYEPSWEPPIDVLETDEELLIFVALPGVDPDDVVANLAEERLEVHWGHQRMGRNNHRREAGDCLFPDRVSDV